MWKLQPAGKLIFHIRVHGLYVDVVEQFPKNCVLRFHKIQNFLYNKCVCLHYSTASYRHWSSMLCCRSGRDFVVRKSIPKGWMRGIFSHFLCVCFSLCLLLNFLSKYVYSSCTNDEVIALESFYLFMTCPLDFLFSTRKYQHTPHFAT